MVGKTQKIRTNAIIETFVNENELSDKFNADASEGCIVSFKNKIKKNKV